MMEQIKAVVHPHGHLIDNRKAEIIIGLIVSIVGLLMLWDAFDGRGHKMPWPASGLAPW